MWAGFVVTSDVAVDARCQLVLILCMTSVYWAASLGVESGACELGIILVGWLLAKVRSVGCACPHYGRCDWRGSVGESAVGLVEDAMSRSVWQEGDISWSLGRVCGFVLAVV